MRRRHPSTSQLATKANGDETQAWVAFIYPEKRFIYWKNGISLLDK